MLQSEIISIDYDDAGWSHCTSATPAEGDLIGLASGLADTDNTTDY